MRLNPDCIRDILLTVEQECDGHSLIYISDGSDLSQKEFLCKYKIDEVLYHINQCNLSGFFTKCVLDLSGGYKIIDLSPKGHEFLADVRNNSSWRKVKSTAEKIGVGSLKALVQIASTSTANLIKESLSS